MKAKQLIITNAAIIALAAIGVTVLVLREPSTVAVPTDETSAVKKVAQKKPVKKTSVSARAKPVAASSAKAAKPTLPEGVGTAAGKNTGEPPKVDGADAEKKAERRVMEESAIPEQSYELWRLLSAENLPVKEAAKRLGIPANTASKIKRRIETRVLAVLKMYE